ncbi:chondroitin AC/alginate lyase [Phlyctochytrium arcticum]|nr:chondroitin AC/alginate lyase [Phlyctochytrium arcticum]
MTYPTKFAAILVLCSLFWVPATLAQTDPATPPPTVYLDAYHLTRNRALSAQGLRDLNPAINRVTRLATEAATINPSNTTVTAKPKSMLPPSKDPHDFYSLSPFWWPNNLTATKLPYVRLPNNLNPDVLEVQDANYLVQFLQDVFYTGLAYFLTGDEVTASTGIKRLEAWFVNNQTRMNPNLQWAEIVRGREPIPGVVPGAVEAVPGVVTGTTVSVEDEDVWDHIPDGWPGKPAGVTRRQFPAVAKGWNTLTPVNGSMMVMSELPYLLDGIILLTRSPSFPATSLSIVQDWLKSYLKWIQTSTLAAYERSRPDYRGIWLDVQEAALYLYTGNLTAANLVMIRSAERVAAAMDEQGRITVEMAKPGSWFASVSYLHGLFTLGQMSRQSSLPIDLFSFTTATVNATTGTNSTTSSPALNPIRRALDFLYPFALANGTGWPTPPNDEFTIGTALPDLLKQAYIIWGDDIYKRAGEVVDGEGVEVWNLNRLWAPYLSIDAAERSGSRGRSQSLTSFTGFLGLGVLSAFVISAL